VGRMAVAMGIDGKEGEMKSSMSIICIFELETIFLDRWEIAPFVWTVNTARACLDQAVLRAV
jgi:hypothetical protein